MKKLVYILGIIVANLMMLSCITKIQHWPGAGLLLTSAVMLFCFVFLPMALINNYKQQETPKKKALHIVTFIVFFMGVMSILFKVQHYPGASALLVLSLPLPFILFLPVYLYSSRKDNNNEAKNFMGVMFGLIFLAVFSVLLTLNVSRDILFTFADSANSNENTIEANRQSTDIKDLNIKESSARLHNIISSTKRDLLIGNANDDINRADYTTIRGLDGTDRQKNIMSGRFDILKGAMTSYMHAIKASGVNENLKNLADGLFSTENKSTENGVITWEEQTFPTYHLALVLDVLTEMESNMAIVESELAVK